MLKVLAISQLPTLAAAGTTLAVFDRFTTEQLLFSGFIAFFAVDRALQALKNRGINLQEISRQVEDVHRWLRKEDPSTGAKLLYSRDQEIVELLKEISSKFENKHNKLDEVLSKEAAILGKVCAVLERVEDRLTRWETRGCPNVGHVERCLTEFEHLLERFKESQP